MRRVFDTQEVHGPISPAQWVRPHGFFQEIFSEHLLGASTAPVTEETVVNKVDIVSNLLILKRKQANE